MLARRCQVWELLDRTVSISGSLLNSSKFSIADSEGLFAGGRRRVDMMPTNGTVVKGNRDCVWICLGLHKEFTCSAITVAGRQRLRHGLG